MYILLVVSEKPVRRFKLVHNRIAWSFLRGSINKADGHQTILRTILLGAMYIDDLGEAVLGFVLGCLGMWPLLSWLSSKCQTFGRWAERAWSSHAKLKGIELWEELEEIARNFY